MQDNASGTIYKNHMTWTPNKKATFLGHLIDLIERTCDLAQEQNERNEDDIALCRWAANVMRGGHMPDPIKMQDILIITGGLTYEKSFAAGYALGRSRSRSVIQLFLNGSNRPLEIATPIGLLHEYGVSPERAALVQLRFPPKPIPEGDLILIDVGQLSHECACHIITKGRNFYLADAAIAAPYRILTCFYGDYDSCDLHRLDEDEGVTPIGRAITTLSKTPLPSLGEAQKAEFELILQAWQKKRPTRI